MNTKNTQNQTSKAKAGTSKKTCSNLNILVKNNLLGVGVTNASSKDILEYIVKSLTETTENYFIVTPNPEILVYANHNQQFKNSLNRAKIALCDGVGLQLAGNLMGRSFKERITGVDLLSKLCARVAEKPITVGFLGAGPGVAEQTAECLRVKYPGLKVTFIAQEWPNFETNDVIGTLSAQAVVQGPVSRFPTGARSGFGRTLERTVRFTGSPASATFQDSKNFVSSPRSSRYVRGSALAARVDLLFVAFGFPKQEEWMSQNLNKGYFQVAMGVGGAFDYLSGQVPRAPLILRRFGLEWLFRLLLQPWRMKRQLRLLEFIYLVLKEKFRSIF